MEVLIHYPETTEGRRSLERCAAVFHAQYVASRVRKLPCSKEQKLRLIDEVIRLLRSSGSAESIPTYRYG